MQCFFWMILGGLANGYFTTRAMKYFGAEEWRFAASASCTVLPFFITANFAMVDIIEWFEKSNQIAPFTSILLYMFLWFIFNLPGTYFGSYLGFMKCNDKPPCKVSLYKKPIPKQPWYLNVFFTWILASFIIFTTVMSELHFVITSVWRSQILGLYFALLLNINLTICVIGLVSMLTTYMSLRAGNWNWWWRSFFQGFGVGLWIFIYCMYHMIVEF